MTDFDMRGMCLSDRKELLKWYFLNVDSLVWRGRHNAYKYLVNLPADDKEFATKALKCIMDEGDEEDDIATIEDKEAVDAYIK